MAIADCEEDQDRKLKTLAELRKKSKNTLHLAAVVMEDRQLQTFGRMMQRSQDIGHAAMVSDLQAHATQEGAAQWHAERASDFGNKTCKALAMSLSDVSFLKSLSLTMARFPGSPAEVFEDETAIAAILVKLMTEHMASHAWSKSKYAMVMPHSLAIGLHSELPIARKGLQQVVDFWATIQCLEELAIDSGHPKPELHGLLKDLSFHQEQLVREVLAMVVAALDAILRPLGSCGSCSDHWPTPRRIWRIN
jgi:hypothetical protein